MYQKRHALALDSESEKTTWKSRGRRTGTGCWLMLRNSCELDVTLIQLYLVKVVYILDTANEALVS
jgi:hypothetical protein